LGNWPNSKIFSSRLTVSLMVDRSISLSSTTFVMSL
jgi:hypothetical protein